MKSLFDTAKDGVVLRLHVQPGAGREAIIGVHGDALKVQIVAPPVSGRANQAIVSLLARTFGVDAGTIKVTGGAHARLKRVKLTGVDPEEFEKQLEVAVREAGPDRFSRRR